MSNIKLIYYHYKGEKKKNTGVIEIQLFWMMKRFFIQNLRATISDIYDVL